MNIWKSSFLSAAFLSIISGVSLGQTTVPGQRIVPLGYCQLSAMQLSSAVGLSSCSGGIPSGATMAYIQSEVAGVRYRDDGTAPTSSVGVIIANATPIFYVGTLSALQFIAQSGSPLLDVLFYR